MIRKLFYVSSTVAFLCVPFKVMPQALHLVQTLNYGKHISDINFAKSAPFAPLNYIYKIHPKENIAYEVLATDSPADTTARKKYVPPPPESEYAFRKAGQEKSYILGPGEWCCFFGNH